MYNDGGAVSIGSNDNTIVGNFLLNSVGNVDQSNGCGSTNNTPCMHHSSYGMGVGADDNYKNITVENNTIAGNNDWGIRFNAFTYSDIIHNTLFNNQDHLILESKRGPSANNSDVLFNRDEKRYSLEHFQQHFAQETYSEKCNFKFSEYQVLSSSTEMFSNTQFNNNLNGWNGGSYQAVTVGLNGGNLQFTNKNTTGFVSY